MATFLRFVSKTKLREVPKFRLTCFQYYFKITRPIEVLDWPSVFSKYILEWVKEDLPSDTFISIKISHPEAEGNIPFMHSDKLLSELFDEHFERIFSNVDVLGGILSLEVTLVTVPGCC